MYLISDKIKDSTLIQIGMDLGILPLCSVATEENIDKVVKATWFYLDISMPKNVVKGNTDENTFTLEVSS